MPETKEKEVLVGFLEKQFPHLEEGEHWADDDEDDDDAFRENQA